MAYITKLPFEGIFKVTYPYGILDSNYASGKHDGIDMSNSQNPNVYSIVDGEVSYAGWENVNNKKQGFGLYASIKFDINEYGFKKVFLAHLNELKVSVGQKVSPSTIIGIMGSTGFTTGPHTHVEIREYNNQGILTKKLNPANFMGISNTIGTYDSANYRINTDNKYITGRYVVNTPSGVNVRVGPSISYNKKSLNELTYDAEKQGGYVNGTIFDVLEVSNNWGRTPSGWVCLDYCKKI